MLEIDDISSSKKCHAKFCTLPNDLLSTYFGHSTHACAQGGNEDQKILLENISNNHSADTDYKDFMNIYEEYTRKPYSFLTSDCTLPADKPLCLIINLLESFIKKTTLVEEIKILDYKFRKD